MKSLHRRAIVVGRWRRRRRGLQLPRPAGEAISRLGTGTTREALERCLGISLGRVAQEGVVRSWLGVVECSNAARCGASAMVHPEGTAACCLPHTHGGRSRCCMEQGGMAVQAMSVVLVASSVGKVGGSHEVNFTAWQGLRKCGFGTCQVLLCECALCCQVTRQPQSKFFDFDKNFMRTNHSRKERSVSGGAREERSLLTSK